MISLSAAVNLRGSSFQLVGPQGEPLTLQLTEVEDRGTNDWVEQFSLLFRGPLAAPLQQNLYGLQHETLGAVDWMLVPVGKDTEGYTYEAVFNLLKQGE
ncbi:DUF6916 family protein [Paenibacillus hexagrammi]|uniref:DUF6916 domain-containing protein n=1 Tax=Paenibacillus hexagrammi TaxID=2908839 RepID=A0ABY3SLG9_9BACL|nr:hypothetical protein [Paenibacillus sp. YPD9-1]UJF33807.1 hypothetical protein L0M14_00615 [Paenibacillus sp. YPD9-1]